MMFFSGKKRDYLKYLAITKDISNKIICIDIDNTLSDTNAEIKKRGYDISCYPNPYLNDNFWKSDFGKKIFLDAKPIKNTIRIVQTLVNMGGKPIFATSRPLEAIGVTQKWLMKYLLPLWGKNSIFFSKNKVTLNADIYFEDNPNQISQMLKANKIVFAPKYSYNSTYESPRMIYYETSINFKKGVSRHAAKY